MWRMALDISGDGFQPWVIMSPVWLECILETNSDKIDKQQNDADVLFAILQPSSEHAQQNKLVSGHFITGATRFFSKGKPTIHTFVTERRMRFQSISPLYYPCLHKL